MRALVRCFVLIIVATVLFTVPQRGWSANGEIVNVGVLKNFPPIYLTNSDTQEPEGFAIDIFEQTAQAASIEFRYKTYETWSSLVAAFRAGDVDLIPNLGVTEERKSFASFTSPVHTFAVSLFVRSDSSDIRGIQDLGGRRVSVVKENVGARLMKDHPSGLLVVHHDPEQALLSLLSGRTDALVYPQPILRRLAIAAHLDDQISVVGKPLIEIKRAIAVRKDVPELLAKLTGPITQFTGTPAHQKILAKWYGTTPPFWTPRRVAIWMGVVFIVSMLAVLFFRYRSLTLFNKALAVSEERFRDYADATAEWYFEQDEYLRFTFVSDQGETVIGLPQSTVVGKTRWEAVEGHTPPEEDHQWREHQEVMEAHKSWHDFAYTFVRDDGERRVVTTSAKALFDKEGVFRGYRGVGRDVTEEFTARENLSLHSSVLETIEAGILITDARRGDNPIIFANPSIERMTGYKASEVMGRNPRFLQGDDRDQPEREGISAALKTSDPVRVVLRNYRKDGTQFLSEVNIFPVRDTHDRVSHFVGIQTDVTGRRQTEHQLQQMQKMDSIGQLTGGVAHDFNNLLTVIMGNLELLDSNLKENKAAKEYLDEAIQAAELGSSLSHRLLAFSRQQTLEPKVVNLNQIVLDMQDMLRRTLGETIDVSTVLAHDLNRTRVDPGQVESAILNLAINARDAMPNGGRLTIQTANESITKRQTDASLNVEPGKYVSIGVTDTGEGMAPELVQQIFEPFFTTKDVGKGTGLGLSMVYGFVKQSGGNVVAESKLGSGTTVKLYLPQHAKDASERATTKAQEEASDESNETILVVEDDKLVRNVTVKRLKALGYVVLEAEDGPTALSLLEHSDHIDLLFTDYVMPKGMSGSDLAERVRSTRPDVKIMFTSGYAESELELKDDIAWLRKPYKAPALAKKLREVLASD